MPAFKEKSKTHASLSNLFLKYIKCLRVQTVKCALNNIFSNYANSPLSSTETELTTSYMFHGEDLQLKLHENAIFLK